MAAELGRAIAHINLAAVERNCTRLARALSGGAELCAVVKADGYGHGAAPCAAAARQGGATWLAVATAGEAAALRAAGIEGRLLVMGALTGPEIDVAVEADADVVTWDERFVAALAGRPLRVHVKLDSGMGRLGTRDVDVARRVVAAIDAAPGLTVAGAMTHFATADEVGDAFLRRAARDLRSVRGRGQADPSRRASSTPPTPPPRCATPPPTSTSCAAAWPSTASTRSSATRPSRTSSPRSTCARTSPRSSRSRRARARATGGGSSPTTPPRWPRSRSATATACAAR